MASFDLSRLMAHALIGGVYRDSADGQPEETWNSRFGRGPVLDLYRAGLIERGGPNAERAGEWSSCLYLTNLGADLAVMLGHAADRCGEFVPALGGGDIMRDDDWGYVRAASAAHAA